MASQKRPIFTNAPRKEVSLLATLVRTVVLLWLTLLFLLLVRFFPSVSHLVQHIAGSTQWQKLYGLFHIETALGREQLILLGIVLVAFLLALFIQLLGLWLLRRLRGR